jgi:hypothetical protein
MKSTITLQNTARGVTATFAGPAARPIIELFGCDTIPCPYRSLTPNTDNAKSYIRAMKAQWPEFQIQFI